VNLDLFCSFTKSHDAEITCFYTVSQKKHPRHFQL